MRDRGLKAVIRVRAVRELDSRVGLTQALGEQRQLDREVEELGRALAGRARFEGSTGAEFLGHRNLLSGAAQQLTERKQAAAVADGISTSARARWQDDRGRLGAVEMLLERRVEAHSAELARVEAAQNDDIATQRWARQAGAVR